MFKWGNHRRKFWSNLYLPRIMCTFLPKFLKEKQGYALYMGIMITYHGHNDEYNNPTYNVQKTWMHIIHGKMQY